MMGVVISGNTAPGGSGGGISNSGTLNVTDSTISNNTVSFQGGGILNGNVTNVTNSTISGNTAQTLGGGISSVTLTGSLTVTNSTISGNVANGNGGGINAGGSTGVATVTNTTITNNSNGFFRNNGSVTLRNTIIAANQNNAVQPDIVSAANPGEYSSTGYNLIGNPGSIVLSGPGDRSGTSGAPLDPRLGPLQNNGGPTQTHALLAGSPAIDGGNSSGSFNDQRGPGFLRVIDLLAPNASGGDGADIGAFELQSEPPPATVSISGVIRRPSGTAISNTRVFLNDAQGNRVGLSTTGSFGIYTFSNVATGQTYFITVSSKRYRFAPQSVTPTASVSGLDLVGLE